MAVATPPYLSQETPLVGRDREKAFLEEVLRGAQEGRGCAVTVSGPGGMGKTRLLRWLEGEARGRGFRVRWGYCLKESLEPYFPLEQLFSDLGKEARTAPDPASALERPDPPTVLLIEEERPSAVLAAAERLCGSRPTLLLARERGTTLRQRYPRLERAKELLWLSRTPAEDAVDARALDAMGDRLEGYLRRHPGALVAVSGLDYVVSQTGFGPTLRLVQFLRDVAEETGGRLLLGFHPVALEVRQLSLLEAEGEVYRAPAEGSRPGSPAPSDPSRENASQRLLRYSDTLSRASAQVPHLMLLDDLQWADPQSILAFQFLARNLRGQRVLLIASVREEEDRPQETGVELLDVFDHLEREDFLHRLPLRGLDEGGSKALAEAVFGGHLAEGGTDPTFLEFLQRAGGNPYFVLETARELIAEGAARRTEAGEVRLEGRQITGDAAHLPASIRRMMSHRLASMGPEERRLVQVASIMGSEFDLAPLAGVLDADGARAQQLCQRLQDRLRLMQPVAGSPTKWSFAHPMTWEAVLAEVPPEEEARISRALARWYASHRPHETAILARLWHMAGVPEEGLPMVRRALRDAVHQQAGETIVRYHAWLQDFLRSAGASVPSRVEEGLALEQELWMQGSFRPAEMLLHALEGLGPDLPSRWAMERAKVDLLVQQDLRQAQSLLQRVWREMEEDPGSTTPLLRARWLNSRARVRLGSSEEGADKDSEEALSLLGDEGPAEERCRSLYYLGYLRLGDRRTAEGLAPVRAGLELAKRARLPLYEADFLSLLAMGEPQLGDWRSSVHYGARCVELYRQNGGAQWLAIALANLARVLEDRGEHEAAMQQASEGLELARKFDLPRLHAMTLLLCGELRANAGLWEEALPFLERAAEMNERLGFEDRGAATRLFLLACKGHLGSPQESLSALEEFVRKEESLEVTRRIRLHLLLAGLRERAGEGAIARRELDLALERSRKERLQPLEREVLEHIVRWDQAHGRAEEARQMEERAEELGRIVRGDKIAPGLGSGPGPGPAEVTSGGLGPSASE